jgi:hypothetical protein
MKTLTTRLIALGALAMGALLASCTDPVAPRSLPRRPALATLTTDITAPVTPTPVAADVIATVNRSGILIDSILVTWVDNETRADELVTCARFTGAGDAPVTTQCAYASDYDVPVGTTGIRTAVLIAPAGAAITARFWAARFFLMETLPGSFDTFSVKSAQSAPIEVTRSVDVATKGNGEKR